MTDKVLSNCLRPIIRAESSLRQRRWISFIIAIGGLALLILLLLSTAGIYRSVTTTIVIVAATFLILVIGMAIITLQRPSLKSLAVEVEDKHPDLNSLLLTAMDMQPGPDGQLTYLQTQVLEQVTEHAIRNRWVKQVSEKKLVRAGWIQIASLAAFAFVLWFCLGASFDREATVTPSVTMPTNEAGDALVSVIVQPGDMEVEKGSRVVVEATFHGGIPSSAMVVMHDIADDLEIGRLTMRPKVEDTVFSTIIARVDRPTRYTVHYDQAQSQSYTIQTYQHPELHQADATVTPPAYTELPARTVQDTRKLSVLEGSQVDWSIQVSQPIAAGELFGEDDTIIPLTPSPDDATVLVASQTPEKSQKYRLHLVDTHDRTNKRPPWIEVNVKRNQPPKLEFAFPKRDVNVTTVEELAIEAKVWDDLGIKQAGIVFQHGAEKEEVLLSDEELEGNEHHQLTTMLAIEKLGAQPRDLITYHLWAEDLDREGQLRRTQSDMFLAEVRHFDATFRQGQPGQGGEGESGSGVGNLLKIQKDILNATWKVLRRAHLGKTRDELQSDISVLTESQMVAIKTSATVEQEIDDPEMKAYIQEARKHMEQAVDYFTSQLSDHIEELELANVSVRAAYQELIKARAREHTVTQSESPSQGQPQDPEQQMLMNLELKQKDLRYKENTKATDPEEEAQKQANLEVLNKLKELARRQEAIAEKIKELENQLAEAKTQEEKDKIERQLKRLQEEQEQLLRDLDDLSQTMDSEQNRAEMAEERQRLEEIRQDVRETAEDLEAQDLADAANSATRAQRELEQVEDEFRQRTARQFSTEMKDIREAARELAERQEEISKKLDEKAPPGSNTGNPFRSPEENRELANQLSQQQQDMEDLLEQIKDVSEQAEESEPLLSDALYDAVRETTVNGVTESLFEANRMLRYNRRTQAREPEQNAAQGIADLKERVEKAAEKILGSEADSLRLARSEIDRLIEQTQKETDRLRSAASGQQPDPEAKEPAAAGDLPDPKEGKGGKGKGEKGKGESDGQLAKGGEKGKGQAEENGKGQADGKGKGKGKGKGDPTELAQAGEGEGEEGQGQAGENGKGKGKADSKGKGKGQGKGTGSGRERGRSLLSQGRSSSSRSSGGMASNFGGDGSDTSQTPTGLAQQRPLFFDSASEAQGPQERGPITGEDYKDFANALGNIEEMLNAENLRNDAARVLDNARAMRIDFKRDNAPPGAATIDMEILMPLVELRSRVSEELARLNKDNPIAPIDRDAVPAEFSELVRKYYEELGAGE